MNISEFSIRIIVLLLPGIIATALLQMLTTKGKIENREFIVYSIIFGFLSYWLVEKIVCKYINMKNHFFDVLLNNSLSIDINEVFTASLFGIGIGIVASYVSNSNMIYKIASFIKITTNSGNVDVWSEKFENSNKSCNCHVGIYNKNDNLFYYGWPHNYSVKVNKRELLLTNVKVYRSDDRNVVVREVDEMYFQFNSNDFIVIELEKDEKC